MKTFKVSKITSSKARTINLGNYNSVKLEAGIEIVLDKPETTDSKEVTEAYSEARRLIADELLILSEPYKKYFEAKPKGGEQK